MTEKQRHEEACLEAVKEVARDIALEEPRKTIHDVRLDGSYPDTRLIVDISVPWDRAELDWGLWGDDFGERAPGDSPYPPAGVAQDVIVELYEFGFEGPPRP